MSKKGEWWILIYPNLNVSFEEISNNCHERANYRFWLVADSQKYASEGRLLDVSPIQYVMRYHLESTHNK